MSSASAKPAITIELASAATTVGRDLAAGGVFVGGCALPLYAECELVVLGSAGRALRTAARVVWVEAGRGAGLELVGFGPGLRDELGELVAETLGSAAVAALGSRPPGTMLEPAGSTEPTERVDLVELAAAADADADADADPGDDLGEGSPGEPWTAAPWDPTEAGPDDDGDDDDDEEITQPDGTKITRRQGRDRAALNVHERVRRLTQSQALKLAHTGELAERVALEKVYSKFVWEALLRNPRVSPPEVARIARMGTLPRPTIEVIVGNGAWLAIPEIRRALLANPRLGPDQILRILRVMPRPELKLATIQTAYPNAVRDAARRLYKD